MSDLLQENLENKTESSTHEFRIIIDVPREEVFEFVLEPNNSVKWSVNIEFEEVDTDQIGLGTRYTNNFGSLEVTDYERNVYCELSDPNTEYQCSYSFRKIDDDTTELIYFEGMLDGSSLDKKMDTQSFNILKDILERN